MQCANHANVEAFERCAGCAEAFCSNCLVEIHGTKYCGSCKVMTVKGQPGLEAATTPCKEANEAFTWSLVGIFCCAIILEPIAIVKAFQAKALIDADPRLTGSGKAYAAIITGFIRLGMAFLDFIAQAMQAGKH